MLVQVLVAIAPLFCSTAAFIWTYLLLTRVIRKSMGFDEPKPKRRLRRSGKTIEQYKAEAKAIQEQRRAELEVEAFLAEIRGETLETGEDK